MLVTLAVACRLFLYLPAAGLETWRKRDPQCVHLQCQSLRMERISVHASITSDGSHFGNTRRRTCGNPLQKLVLCCITSKVPLFSPVPYSALELLLVLTPRGASTGGHALPIICTI